ncbi:MerR family transcriptional regulator [Phaeovulum sp.]|uniref:MerR family transcriptional regulator n=1 Tax=Phaeovulum sp. TaxID=2934796 RepID=UPI0027310631|nr:MerR family transcriptional regulator [Phaeovulum sp.]MDP1668504.1 MerR family transcriptional regulator [Phaeovulum sp.]MDZ4118787.1 MerR family transcriptional regulator [Phaeovulum sp.]
MRIGELAEASGVSVDTLRFYERRGLVPADRRGNGYRDYPEPTVALVRLIRLAQRLGFSLREIEAVAKGLQATGLDERAVADMLRAKIAEVEARAADLMHLRDLLQARLDAACPLRLT